MSKYEVLTTDIAVLGSGGAGLLAVLHAKKANTDLEITLVSKGAVGRSGCTRMVQGGFNAVLDENDSLEKHYVDTLKGGKFLKTCGLGNGRTNEGKRFGWRKLGEARLFEARVIIIVDRIDPDHPLPSVQQGSANVESYESGCAGNDNCHSRLLTFPWARAP